MGIHTWLWNEEIQYCLGLYTDIHYMDSYINIHVHVYKYTCIKYMYKCVI